MNTQPSQTMPPQSSPVPDRVEGQFSASGLQLQWNSQLRHVFHEMCVSRTHRTHFYARIHGHGRMLGWITCSEHKTFLTDLARVASLVAQAEAEDPLGDKTSLKIASRATTLFEFALFFAGAGRPGGALQMMTMPGVMSTQLAQKKKKPPVTILPNVADSGSFHTSCTDLSRWSLSCICRLRRGASNPNLCVRICFCPEQRKCRWRHVYRGSSRCTHFCDHLWHPFPLQPCCR